MAATSFKETLEDDNRSWPIADKPRRNTKNAGSAISEIAQHRSLAEDYELLQQLKNRRSRALAAITRKSNLIEPLLFDAQNVAIVERMMDDYHTAFYNFNEVHDTYDNAIQDSQIKADSFMYFVDVKKRYIEFCNKVNTWTTDNQQINPEDSASQIFSTASSESRVDRIAELEARRASIQRRKELHKRELRLKEEKLCLDIERENVELDEQISSLKAKERAHSNSKRSQVSKQSKLKPNFKPNDKFKMQANFQMSPIKPEWTTPKGKLLTPEFYSQTTSSQKQVIDQQSKILNEMVLQQQRSTLPQRQIPSFNGNPLDYCSFIRAFDTIIASKEPDYSSKLYYLEQYTTGRPQELVKSCLHMDPEEGYKKARDTLEQRFGEKYRIAMAHVEKLLSISPIRPEDADALERYSISLTSCKNALQGIGYLNKIENPDIMRRIIEKLPFKFQDRWRDIADNIINVKHREVTIEDIATFVEQKARCMSNPIFGKLSSNVKPRTERTDLSSKYRSGTSNHKTVFATQLKDSSEGRSLSNSSSSESKYATNSSTAKLCYVCDGEHTVVCCPVFKKKTHDERMDLASKNRLCFSCLRKGHQSVSCFKRKPCNDCSRRHHTLLHSEWKATDQPQSTSTNTASQHLSTSSATISASPTSLACSTSSPMDSNRSSSTVLPIIPIKIRKQGDCSYIQTYALLDSGSNSSFCSESLVKRLKADSKKTKIKLTTINNSNDVESQFVRGLEVSDLDENTTIKLPAVFSRPVIPVSKDEMPTQADVDSWPQFHENVHLQFIDSDVDLLIGMNVPEALQPMEIISTASDGPYATKVKLGWVINGPTGRYQKGIPQNSFQASMQCAECADFLQMDTYSDSKEYSREESKFMDRVEESINHHQDGHYEVCLPLKDTSVSLPNNRAQAERRAAYLKNKLLSDTRFKEDYVNFMKDMIEKGHARKVPQDQLVGEKGKVWYIPHHGIYHKKKPSKIRVVFDCSSKFQGVSLNDVLLQGPDLTNSLFGVLLRFRQESIAFMADIEGMFLQVRVPESDRSLLRFLWWTDGKLDQEFEEYQMNAHLFGAVSSPSCANFTLRHNANKNKTRYQEEVISTVFKNFYVDDCLKSLPSAEMAIHFIKDISKLMKDGGFRLTKWISSSREVIQSIPESERAKEVKELDLSKENLPAERALGVTWHVESDSFGFKTTPKEYAPTRRGLMSLVSSVYDPLGMAIPFTLTAKIIMQDLTRLKLKWDDSIPDEFQCPWQKWLYELPRLADFSLDRYMKSRDLEGCMVCELHHFADASQKAYGTVSYLRTINSQGSTHSSFIMAKSHLAPLKSQTIPRLELAAAALSVKSDKMLRAELEIPIESSTFWTDSTTVIRYIENESRKFHTYVANRVTYIRNGSSSEQWNYIDTKSNPADACTRGMPIDVFLSNENWKTGPELLQKTIVKPTRPSNIDFDLTGDPEVKADTVSLATHAREDPLEAIFRRFSLFLRLKKFIALCVKLQRKFIERKRNLDVKAKESSLISLDELRYAEHEILRHVQNQFFLKEITDLTNNAKVKKSSHILKMDPVLSDGLLRVGGRLRKSSIPHDSKHQIIVPKETSIAKLIVQEAHQTSGHSGREYVLSIVRQKFWIVHANALVRRVLAACFECRRRQSKPNTQKMADLPAARITPDQPPFTNTGIDYFGPFMVKQKRSLVKRYGVIFTCLAVRAIHIEVASSLETDTFILALRRFIARRGQVKRIYSDNGTNLVGGERELREAIAQWNNEKIHNCLIQREIEWHFSPPLASHYGGTWERCIRTIRKVLNAISKEQQLDDESFLTLMTEVEAIVNGRPLTTSSDDPRDDQPITPNHLLLLDREPSLPPGIFDKNDIYPRKRWRQVQYMSDLFWKRWTREYLPLLQQRTKWMHPKKNLGVDDVVLLLDESSPRNAWPIGRVIDVIPDSRGLVRRAKVKTNKGVFERAIHKLCLLEAYIG